MRRKTKSIELPDLDPAPRRAQPIPIGPLSIGRTDSDAERRVGGQFGNHIPPEVALRNGAVLEPPPTRVDHSRMASLMAEVEHSPAQEHTPENERHQTYQEPPAIEQHHQQQQGDIFHSRLRFGFERHALVSAGLLPPSTTLEETTSATAEPEATSDVTVISPSEVASGLVNPAMTLAAGVPSIHAFTSVEIKWTGVAEDVILSLYSPSVGGLGTADIIKADDDSYGHGLYRMQKVECVSLFFSLYFDTNRQHRDEVFTSLLNLAPGTHHMRFFVSNALQITPESPLPPDSYGAYLSTTLPTSPDPSGTLANYVVVAPMKAPGVGTGRLEVGEGGGAAVKPILPEQVANVAPQLQVPTPQVMQQGHGLGRGGEPGQSFWSKGSEEHDSDHSDHENQDEEVKRVRAIEGETRERDRNKAGWTNEIPLELIQAAEEEEKYLDSQKVHSDDETRWSTVLFTLNIMTDVFSQDKVYKKSKASKAGHNTLILRRCHALWTS